MALSAVPKMVYDYDVLWFRTYSLRAERGGARSWVGIRAGVSAGAVPCPHSGRGPPLSLYINL